MSLPQRVADCIEVYEKHNALDAWATGSFLRSVQAGVGV